MIAKLKIRTNFMVVPGSAKHLLSDKQSGSNPSAKPPHHSDISDRNNS
jgi:hypothetical protein